MIDLSIKHELKYRDKLRSRAEAQFEIDVLVRQAGQEFESLMDKIRENSELIAANGEVIRIDEEDPVLPIQVVKDSIRRKYEVAVAQMDINMCHTVARLLQLRNRASQLNREDGPVHKINRVISALVREQRDLIGDDDEAINSNTPPEDAIRFISNQITDLGCP
eukprot:scaffold53083_cov54-Cyclotella_meneghiniana.AAC.1